MTTITNRGQTREIPARPLNLVLHQLGWMPEAAKFGVQVWNGSTWVRFPTHRTPKPGDRLRICTPPEKKRPGLAALMLKMLQLPRLKRSSPPSPGGGGPRAPKRQEGSSNRGRR